MWHSLSELSVSDDIIQAKIKAEENSFWFSGHFPGQPVLPGIAELGMVFEVIQRARAHRLVVTGLSRVKFRQLVVPGDLLKIQAAPDPHKDGSYSFRIAVKEKEVCSGVMNVKRKEI